MPRFSVIVPAYQVQAYLPACLESVLSQSCPDLELIAVDDGSPDACGALIEEFAACDPRVRPVHLPENTGPGPARNAGLDRAAGDYVLFLDGDDTLAPDALLAIADRLKETDDPDVLVYDHARVHWSGQAVRNRALSAPLTEHGPAPFRAEDRPGLMHLPAAAWNKAYRRDFLEAEGFRFPPGCYEDVPWAYSVLMAARTVATLDRVCVHLRQRRVGSLLCTAGERHFDVFGQYDRVFAYVERRPELAHWRPLLFRRMVGHLTAVYSRRERLPHGSRALFLRRARAHYRRHRAPGVPLPPRERIDHAVVRFGLHRTHRMLRLARALGRGTARRTGRLLGALRSAALRLHYHLQRLLPLRADCAVFASGEGHGGDPGALESAFREFAPHIRTAWVVEPASPHSVPPGPRRLAPGTAAYWSALARSTYLVSDSHFEPGLRKRRGQVLVQTGTGTPLQHRGLDLLDRPAVSPGAGAARLVKDAGRWDYVVSANRHATLTWERACPGRYTVLEYGRPCTDRLYTATEADVARLRESLGIPAGAVALLYAPARREHRRSQPRLLDLERVVHRLGPRFVILARIPGPAGPPRPAASGRVLDVSTHPNLASLCLASDALITDYSPLMADYAGLDRPIVLHTPDRETYEEIHGSYLDVTAFPPGAVTYSEDELIDVFTSGHWRGSRSAQLRAAFRARFCPHDDGRVAERVVRRVLSGEIEQPPAIPLPERRPVPSAAALHDRPRLTAVPPQHAAAPRPVAAEHV
ncbi:bifunctional glycosyltransferase family 2 protein/CDP-glycerol:glycerophosphate glycerophosphotransferase [Streptomyces sp. SBST2-5]|uniref:Bifunctional glycosyltransferase family 2 protein/CDP-glycerol:glycerophosphate glycerophosphotransferase n=1 Tax=Streptomyces composti TaxID=2720025 RepID=A0ABX1AFI3_9ACTN|nr:bifunctional glycosyltransferase family 2 protein/CDP-glycerol:glycerophosphate glycerophosphotransferase [Streptomyces composti]NJP53439.1 bifunctional glycosyltransferase family 2 protein/CDP-glycerol:glycerophosphate glycerophosphotransferase [Streptomyces composti]